MLNKMVCIDNFCFLELKEKLYLIEHLLLENDIQLCLKQVNLCLNKIDNVLAG